MADFKFDPLREVKTCSRSSFKLSSDTWQTDFIFNANLFTWVCHFYWSVWTSWTLLAQLTTWKFQRTEQNVLGPDITETIVTAPLNKPTFDFEAAKLNYKTFNRRHFVKLWQKSQKRLTAHWDGNFNLLLQPNNQICNSCWSAE